MTDQQTFDTIAEIRILRKEFEMFKDTHEEMAKERQFNTMDRIEKLTEKLEHISCVLEKLPCEKHESMQRQVSFMWLVISGIMATMFFAMMHNTNSTKTMKDEVLEAIKSVSSEVKFVEEHSHGVQEYLATMKDKK